MISHQSSCRGNVLFLILIAVALFAALSYAVTSSTRNSGGDAGDNEKTSMSASRLMNYGSLMQSTIDRMRITQGLGITEIYVENNATKWADDTARYCCLESIPDPRRGLFHPEGGGLVLQSFEDLGTPFAGGTKYGHSTYVWARIPSVGVDADADMVLWTVGLKRDVCEAINRRSEITSIPEITFSEADFVTDDPIPVLGVPTGSGADIAAITGKTDFCFEYPDGRLFYNRVLKEN